MQYQDYTIENDVKVAGDVKETYTYTRDKSGNIISEVIEDANGETTETTSKTYTYDRFNRLVEALNGTDLTEYSYDKVGNRLEMVTASGTAEEKTLTYAFNAQSQLTSISEGSTTKTTYTYDLNGNTQTETAIDYVVIKQGETVVNHADKVTTYDFSVKGETVSALVSTPSAVSGTSTITTSNVETKNSYNAEGQRVVKEEGLETMRYYYSGGAVLYTVDQTETMRTENVLDLSGAIILSSRFAYETENDDYANGDYLYRYDIRSSVMNIVDEDGTVVTGYTYDEFGKATKTDAQDFLNENEFAGAVSDKSTGLVYMNARFYSPTTGRFISQDTYSGSFFEPWTQHLYAYCNNNPASMIDPTGHYPYKVKDFQDMDLETYNKKLKEAMISSGGLQPDGYIFDPWVEWTTKGSLMSMADENVDSPKYDPKKYNDDGKIQKGNNCLSYILDVIVKSPIDFSYEDSDMIAKMLQGGNIGPKELADFLVAAANRALLDHYSNGTLEHLYQVTLGESNAMPTSTRRNTALAIDSNVAAYHWYRQDSDGLYSHKDATGLATCLDGSGKLIYDICAADRTYTHVGPLNQYQDSGTYDILVTMQLGVVW